MSAHANDTPLRTLVQSRVDADTKLDPAAGLLILAALAGPDSLTAALEDQHSPKKPPADKPEAPPTHRGAFLRSIAVEGFRGIGPEAALTLTPGPGLTLVVGRNGSGKSSFAEGLELLLTGDSRRWSGRTSIWKEGWRNLHHKPAKLAAELLLEGQPGPCRAWRAELDAPTAAAQVQGQPRTTLDALGWESALQTYRPFLSYNELGSLLEDGPSKLYDQVFSILGLEELAEAQKALAEASARA